VRENEFYNGYDRNEHDEFYQESTDDHDFVDDRNSEDRVKEMARDAVGRIFEPEPYVGGYESRRDDYPPVHDEPQLFDDYIREQEPVEDDWRTMTPPAPQYDMADLASKRRERADKTRRREPNPTVKPAVRVGNEHRRRRTAEPLERHEAESEWHEADEDIANFRSRYSSDVVSSTKESRVEMPPQRKSSRRVSEPARSEGDGGAGPLRVLLGFVFIGVLIVMTFLAFNNRNLRQALEEAEGPSNGATDYARDVARMEIELTNYRNELDQYRENIAALQAQLEDLGYPPYDEPYDPYPDETDDPTGGRPHYDDSPPDNDPPPPPPPADPEPQIHVVQAGQFMSHIARLHFGSNAQFYIDLIVAANDDITDPGRIREGQEIIIPPRP